jgi:hypothetical protein
MEHTMKAPKNLRIELEPYPHLRDDDGCVLANDYINDDKMAFILEAVRRMIENDDGHG